MAIETIWKYDLNITDQQLIEVPLHAELLHLGVDPNGRACIWLAVDSKTMRRNLEIIIRGTGHALPHVGTFLGTVVMSPFVWHVFTGPSYQLPRAVDLHYLSKPEAR